MSDELSAYLAPVSDGDPCGPDLRWDPEVTGLDTVVAQVFSADEQGVVEGEVSLPAGLPTPRELAASTGALLARTKSIPVLAANARALWMTRGLAGLALGLEALVAVLERWPDPATGVHPPGRRGRRPRRTVCRARPRASRSPPVRVTDRLGQDDGPRRHAIDGRTPARALCLVGSPARSRAFRRRSDRGGSVAHAAWARGHGRSRLRGRRSGERGGSATPGRPETGPVRQPARTDDPWALLDATLLAMERSNRHSPAVLMLRLIATWKDKDVTYIVKSMAEAGLGLEALVKALQAQIDAASR